MDTCVSNGSLISKDFEDMEPRTKKPRTELDEKKVCYILSINCFDECDIHYIYRSYIL